MSGPKDYSPPPRYSMQVFDGKLNQVFQLQSRLKMLCAEIEGLRVADSELSIHFDCQQQLRKLGKEIEGALKTLLFDYKGTFGQDIYNRVNSEIESKILLLQKQVNLCDAIKTEFAGKKTDYESYRGYLLFYDNSKTSFDDFKSHIIDYLKNNLEANLPEIFNEARAQVSSIEFEKEKAVFDFGFSSKADPEKQAVINHIAQKENAVHRIRAEISNKVLDKLQVTSVAHRSIGKPSMALSADTAAVKEKIEALIRRCDDAAMRKIYTENLRRLLGSKSLKDIFFFKELHDSILESEKTRKAKLEVNGLLSGINKTSFHERARSDRQNLVTLCLNFLNGSSASSNELDNLHLKFKELEKNSSKYFEEELIRQRERLFLKSQIVLCLENLGYEVMADLEVIDFEKENDFLLKVHDQENYLNLKFKEDGSMRYVFQIPTNQNELSTDQKNLKLHEMKVTCDEFQSVLQDLSKMGLNVNLRSEKPIEFDSLVSVPESKRKQLQTKSQQKKQKQQLRKKYLTAGTG